MEEFAPGDLLSQAAVQMSENLMTEVRTTVNTYRGLVDFYFWFAYNTMMG